MRKETKHLIMKSSGVVCAMLFITACGTSDGTVTLVKSGMLEACPNVTVEQMVESFMGNPSWESGTGDGNVKFVNVAGDITYADKPVRATIQFVINEKDKSFQYQAFDINEIPQDNMTAASLMEKMCESVGEQQSSPSVAEQTPKYTRDELKKMVENLGRDEVMTALGKPSQTQELGDMKIWYYGGISQDPDTGNADSMVQITFQDGKVSMVNFH